MTFGKRLIPSTLIATALGAIMYVVGGAAASVGIVAAGAEFAFALIGIAGGVGIGLYEDMKDTVKA